MFSAHAIAARLGHECAVTDVQLAALEDARFPPVRLAVKADLTGIGA